MPLTGTLEAGLKAIKAPQRRLASSVGSDGKPLTLWQLHERLWGSTTSRAELRRIRWHDMRHSFASQLVIAGTPLRQVQEWLGHSTILMTMRARTSRREEVASFSRRSTAPRSLGNRWSSDV